MKHYIQYITEGGNIGEKVGKPTTSIKKEYVAPTIEAFKSDMKKVFPNIADIMNSILVLGSAGQKAVSGDLDLGFPLDRVAKEEKDIPTAMGFNDEEYNKIVTQLSTSKGVRKTTPLSKFQRKALIKLIRDKIAGTTGINIDILKDSTDQSIFSRYPIMTADGKKTGDYVQVDLNFGQEDWLKFSYYSIHASPERHDYKGLHRTQLMLALFAAKGYIFNHTHGIWKKSESEEKPHDVLGATPENAIKTLNDIYSFNPQLTRQILESYEEFVKFLQKQKNQKDIKEAYRTYMKILDTEKNSDIPLEFRDLYKEMFAAGEVKGKWLPESSTLRQDKDIAGKLPPYGNPEKK